MGDEGCISKLAILLREHQGLSSTSRQIYRKPRIPAYSRAKEKEILFTNQDCTIKEGKFLKFPKTNQRLNIGKPGNTVGKLRQLRVVPRYGQYVVELIFACPLETKMTEKGKYMAIDLGIDNLATIVTTTGSRPVLVKGKHIKRSISITTRGKLIFWASFVKGRNRKKDSIPPSD
jgi:putative transposase